MSKRIETYKRVRPLTLDKDSGKGPERPLLFSRLTISKATTNKKQPVRSNTQIFIEEEIYPGHGIPGVPHSNWTEFNVLSNWTFIKCLILWIHSRRNLSLLNDVNWSISEPTNLEQKRRLTAVELNEKDQQIEKMGSHINVICGLEPILSTMQLMKQWAQDKSQFECGNFSRTPLKK